MKSFVACLLMSLLFASCELVKYHPYQDAEGCDTDLTQQNIDRIQQTLSCRDTLRIAFISDTQRRYDDTREAVAWINDRSDIDLVLHGGDLTDFGATDEYIWMTEELTALNKPWLTVIGNHDFLGLGEENYRRIYGAYNYSLNVGHLHLLVLNTVSRDVDYSESVPDFSFIREDLLTVSNLNAQHPDSITHTIVMMHDRPGDEQFNNNEAIPFADYLHQFPGLTQNDPLLTDTLITRLSPTVSEDDRHEMLGTRLNGFCLNGHTHSHQLLRPLSDSTLFYTVPSINKRELYVFTIFPIGYGFESHAF